MTIFLAGLNTIPRSYYEAAEIDGANFWQRLRYVTLPMLSGAIMINLVFGITYGLKVFDIVYVLTNGGPGHATGGSYHLRIPALFQRPVRYVFCFEQYSASDHGNCWCCNC
ncbi:MAG: carbohydrate ABC transporter permease [Ruminococcus sp.]